MNPAYHVNIGEVVLIEMSHGLPGLVTREGQFREPGPLLVQNMPFFGDNYNQITCLTAIDNDGKMLLQSASPDTEHAWVSYDVAAQIHDIDGDGKNEVVIAQGKWIKVLDGLTGREKARYPVLFLNV